MSERDGKTEKLDARTEEAIAEGIRMADADTRRWTPEQVKADAKRATREWIEKINKNASA